MREAMPPSRAILKVALSMAMRIGDQEEIGRLKGLYAQLGKKFGGRRGNPLKEKWTLREKAARLAANSGPTRKKKTKQTTTNNE